MTDPLSQAQSAHVMRLVLDLMRGLAGGLLCERRFAARADDLLLVAAVHIGQVEGRPMPAGKLAEYAGLARPTTIRKLRELQAAGIVAALPGGRYVLVDGFMARPDAAQAIAAAVARADAWRA